MSPIRRSIAHYQGVPSLPITSGAAAWVRHTLGRTGVDVLLGITAYTAYQLGSFLYRPTVQYLIEDGDRSCLSDSDSFAFPDSRQASPVTVSIDSPPWQDNRAATATASENSSLLPSPVTQRTSSTIRISTARKTGSALSALAIAALWAGCSTLDPAAELQDLSAGIEHQTPLGIGFVLPPIYPGESHASIDTLIHEARIIGNRANLLVFPETALVAKTAFERYDAIDRMVEEVCKQYGVWVQLGIDSYDGSWSEEHGIEVKREGRLNQVVLLSPDGVMDSYTKQKLFPCESLHHCTLQPCCEVLTDRCRVLPFPSWDHEHPYMEHVPTKVSHCPCLPLPGAAHWISADQRARPVSTRPTGQSNRHTYAPSEYRPPSASTVSTRISSTSWILCPTSSPSLLPRLFSPSASTYWGELNHWL